MNAFLRPLPFKKIIISFFTIYNIGKFNLEEEGIIKELRNLFRLIEGQNYTAVKEIKILFRQEIETKPLKDRILRDIKNLFKHEKEEEN